MKTSEMADKMRGYIDKLVYLFLNRNTQYAGESSWAANFERQAELNRILRVTRIIEKPYGRPIQFVIDKVDRLINGILEAQDGKKATQLADCIDDGIVYLFITKMLLIEAGMIKDEETVS